ncbi:MAG: DEAD/DEAH box helicase family protein [Candidatus Obscuribacterales bacterium]|nr:DEAD/DEAH box helicase family protein [Candidatus Obscuribacterales bacterium]
MQNPSPDRAVAQRVYQDIQPNIIGNDKIRRPQIEGFEALVNYDGDQREIGLILPVGCGKSGLITLTPFAFQSKRALVVAPGVKIAKQLVNDFTPGNSQTCFYMMCDVLPGEPYPEPAPIRGRTSNRADLEEADVAITNIHQLQGEENRWLEQLPDDFFDLIIFDEGHHNTANSWQILREKFPQARIVNFSATPERADGGRMAGDIIYNFPVQEAIREGFCKRLKAVVLNPRTLKYIRREDNQEVEVSLDEVVRLGEQDAGFRRSIVTATETLQTIVDASINEMRRIRQESSDDRHKIIACCLNYEHCIQVKEAYAAKGLRVEYIHSRESERDDATLERLKNHDLDVIVQVRKLGEGFNHRHLSVAAIFSVFTALSPFVQFVGRIMRVVDERNPASLNNQGVVIFHAGTNIHSRWSDFQRFSVRDQDFYAKLLPIEGIDLGDEPCRDLDPGTGDTTPEMVQVTQQTGLSAETIPLLENDEEAAAAIELLRSKGLTAEQYAEAILRPVVSTKLHKRQAAREWLDDRVKNSIGKILHDRGLNPVGKDLDKKRIGRTNWQLIKAAVDTKIFTLIGRERGQRHEYSMQELEQIKQALPGILDEAVNEVVNAAS